MVIVDIRPSSVCLCKLEDQDLLLFSAVVVMVEVIAAIVNIILLPGGDSFCLMLGEDALFELYVVVRASVSFIHWDKHGVKFFTRVFLGVEDIIRDLIEVKELNVYWLDGRRKMPLLNLIIIYFNDLSSFKHSNMQSKAEKDLVQAEINYLGC